MTKLTRPVKRTTPAGGLRRDLVVTLYPGGVLGIREARCRREYTIGLVTCYRLAIEAERERQAAERRKARGQKVRVRRGLLGRA